MFISFLIFASFNDYCLIFWLCLRIKEFNEWAQCLILDLISNYIPSDNEEIFDVMNLLEDRLQHANGAVVLATIKVFLHLTLSMADVHQQVHSGILLFNTESCTIWCIITILYVLGI